MSRIKYNKCDVTPFHARLFEVMGGQLSHWAKQMGVSAGVIRERWYNGSFPRVNVIIKLCIAAGVSADWLLLGQGDRHGLKKDDEPESFNNEDLLEQIMIAVDTGLKQNKLELDVDKKARLIVLLYKHYKDTGKKVSKENVNGHLKLLNAA